MPVDIGPAVLPIIISSEVMQSAIAACIRAKSDQHLAAGVSLEHAAAAALKQRQVCRCLPIGNLQRDRGLCRMQFLGCSRDRAVNGGQRALAKGRQFPQKPAHHPRYIYKENFAYTKDNKILLILKTGMLLVRGRPNGTTL